LLSLFKGGKGGKNETKNRISATANLGVSVRPGKSNRSRICYKGTEKKIADWKSAQATIEARLPENSPLRAGRARGGMIVGRKGEG